jgi:hypothetical protein
MYVYVWKHKETPFYVGMSKTARRANPFNSGGRGWLCRQTLAKIGPANVVVELHTVNTVKEAQNLERELILKHGRIQLETGTLTNLKPGGDGAHGMSDAGKASLSEHMRLNNPMHNLKTREKATARMHDPDVQEKLRNNNPAKRPEVQAKIRAKWAEPEYRAAMIAKKKGRAIHTDAEKEKRRQNLLNLDNPMREYHKTLNSDPDIKAKRVATLRTPEVQAKISASLKAAWAKRKGFI